MKIKWRKEVSEDFGFQSYETQQYETPQLYAVFCENMVLTSSNQLYTSYYLNTTN